MVEQRLQSQGLILTIALFLWWIRLRPGSPTILLCHSTEGLGLEADCLAKVRGSTVISALSLWFLDVPYVLTAASPEGSPGR